MLHQLGRRALDLVIGLFAVLGFCFVPLGHKTGFEHAKAIVGTRPATEADRGFVAASSKLRQALIEQLRGRKARASELGPVKPASGRHPDPGNAESLSHVASAHGSARGGPVDAGPDATLAAPDR